MIKVDTYQLRTLPEKNMVHVVNRLMNLDYVCPIREAYATVPYYVEFGNGKSDLTEFVLLENLRKLDIEEIRGLSGDTQVLVLQVDVYDGPSYFISDKYSYYDKNTDYLLCDAMYAFD